MPWSSQVQGLVVLSLKRSLVDLLVWFSSPKEESGLQQPQFSVSSRGTYTSSISN